MTMERMSGKNIDLRLVDIDDAQYILGLRTSGRVSSYMSRTENDLNRQIEWIRDYKLREMDKKEYYFIIESKKRDRYGTVRIYDLRPDSFCWGSWIVETGSPSYAAIESALLIYDFGFNKLGYLKSHFDVRKNNKKVIGFHIRFGAKIVNEDELNYYFEIDKDMFEKAKEKYGFDKRL